MSKGHRGGIRTTDKPNDFKGAIKNLWQYLKVYRIQLIVMVVFAIASVVFSVMGPKVMGGATTELFEGIVRNIGGATDGINFAKIANILLLMASLYIISGGFELIQGIVMSNISSELSYNLKKDVSKKLNRMPLAYFDTTSHGEVLSHITNDIGVISNNLNQLVFQVLSGIFTIIGILIMMFSISWQMTLIAICMIPIAIFGLGAIVKRSQKYFVMQQETLGKTTGHIEEMFNSHIIIKTNNGEKQSIGEFKEYNDKLLTLNHSSSFLSGLMQPVMGFISNIGYIAVIIIGAFYASKGVITVGEIQSFTQYVRRFSQPMAQIAQVANVFQETTAASERVFSLLEQPEETKDTKHPVDTKDIKGDVYFAHVNFGYAPNKPVINDFSAIIDAGQNIAIVGPTGAGKTTIIKLLMRFYDVNDGAILIDGYDLKQFKRNDLRQMFGMVLQETWLYNATIRENIRYGRLDATDEEVYAAADVAYADHFIRTLPDGYDTIIEEDSANISQGQKQLLTIARAILADPKILILDEATSSVDTRTEVLIQSAMNNVMEGRTSFIIAHRLSTIKNADSILVVNHGDIVEKGTHEELLEQKGFYYDLYNAQFENHVDESA